MSQTTYHKVAELFSAIRSSALLAAIKPDFGSHVRSILRWYSKTFHTPLHEVDTIPFEDILQAWFEEQYAGMEPQQLMEELSSLFADSNDKNTDYKEAEDEEFYQRILQEALQKEDSDPQKETPPEELQPAEEGEEFSIKF